MNRLDRVAFPLVAVTWALLVVGASVRVHGAGLACPDWPLCFGEVVPRIDFGVAFEFGHRVFAGLVSLGFLGLAGAVIVRRKQVGRLPVALVAIAAVVLAVQIVLGGLTVLRLLAEWTVASHLLAGNTFCLLLLLLALSLRDGAVAPVRAAVTPVQRAASVALAAVVPVQLVLGGLVSSSHAGLVCGTWPTCDGTSIAPTLSGLVGLQVFHRFVAYALVLAALTALATARAGRSRRAAALVALAVLVQASLGIANVLLGLPVELALLHNAGAGAVVLSTGGYVWETWRAPLEASAPVGVARAKPMGLPRFLLRSRGCSWVPRNREASSARTRQ
ncbi:MAG: COX15/CtaA family protein [Myxococcota bacterium]